MSPDAKWKSNMANARKMNDENKNNKKPRRKIENKNKARHVQSTDRQTDRRADGRMDGHNLGGCLCMCVLWHYSTSAMAADRQTQKTFGNNRLDHFKAGGYRCCWLPKRKLREKPSMTLIMICLNDVASAKSCLIRVLAATNAMFDNVKWRKRNTSRGFLTIPCQRSKQLSRLLTFRTHKI